MSSMNHVNHIRPSGSVNELLEQLLRHHHPYTKAALAELSPLSERVAHMHGNRHPELAQLVSLLRRLRNDMDMHLMKEENILFPYIKQLAGPSPVTPPFGTIANPIRVMRAEHDTDRAILDEMVEITRDFTLPPYACASFTALYQGVRALVADLLHHMDLENNHLFPLVIELEKARLGRP